MSHGKGRHTWTRSTLRSLSVVALALVMASVSMLSAPAYVMAADNFSREVRLDTGGESPGGLHPRVIGSLDSSDCSATSWKHWSGPGEEYDDENTFGYDANGGALGSLTAFGSPFDHCGDGWTRYWALNTEGVWPTSESGWGDLTSPGGTVRLYGSALQACPDCTADIKIEFMKHFGTTPDPFVGVTTVLSLPNTRGNNFTSTAFDMTVSVPPEARGFRVVSTRAMLQGFSIVTQDPGGAPVGECDGIPGASGDAGLTWGSAGLTSLTHDQWGDYYAGGAGGCLFESAGVFRYVPPEGLTAGDTHRLGVQISSVDGRNGSANFAWACFSGSSGGAQTVFDHVYSGPDAGAAGPGAQERSSNVPDGAGCIEIIIRQDTYLHAVYIANVEGDPLMDDGSDGTGSGDGQTGCDTPGDLVDVVAWLGFIGCSIVEAVQAVWTAVLNLPGRIAGAIGTLLTALFVPTELGDDWADFIALLDTKVPFVWVSESVAFLSGMLTAGNLAGADLPVSMNILGATVPIDVGAVFDPLADYRWIMAGLVYLGTGFMVFRAVKGALGGGEPQQMALGL